METLFYLSWSLWDLLWKALRYWWDPCHDQQYIFQSISFQKYFQTLRKQQVVQVLLQKLQTFFFNKKKKLCLFLKYNLLEQNILWCQKKKASGAVCTLNIQIWIKKKNGKWRSLWLLFNMTYYFPPFSIVVFSKLDQIEYAWLCTVHTSSSDITG
jgi:hypothetical protein